MLIKNAPEAMIGKYCRECGQKQVRYFTGGFDSKTGKPLELMKCVNPRCSKGCMDNRKHDFPFFRYVVSLGRNITCKNCGNAF